MRLPPLCLLITWLAPISAAATSSPAAPAAPIDFSRVGYANGLEIPAVPARFEVSPLPPTADSPLPDATPAIQAALDAVAALPLDADGFRGAVILRPGTYRINGQLRIRASGTVLRGRDATLIAAGQDRRTLIDIRGGADRQFGPAIAITDKTVPAGSALLTVTSTAEVTAGQRILIRRPSTKEWIASIGMDQFTGAFKDQRLDWHPGTRDLEWERRVIGIDPATNTLTLDAPITTALEQRFGGGTVHTFTWPGRLSHIGVEGLTCISEFDASHPADEEHAWMAISLDHVENAWVREITARHFVSAAVWLGAGTRAITVQDCHSEVPVSENAGWRRFAFYIGGQQTLVRRCTADQAREAFLVGLCSAGPNVFLDCTATNAFADSGSIESFASGALFENVKIDGASLNAGPLGPRYQGAGITTDNVLQIPGFSPITASPSHLANFTRFPIPQDFPGNPAVKTAPIPEPLPLAKVPAFALRNGYLTVDDHALFATATSNAWWKGQTIPARAEKLGWHFARWASGRIGPGLTEDLAALADRFAAADQRLAHVWPGLWYDRRRDDHETKPRTDTEVWAPFFEMPWARSGIGTASDGLSKFDLTKFNPWYWQRLREFTTECATRGIFVYHHFYNHHNLVESASHWVDFPWRSANCLQETGFAEPPTTTDNGRRIGIVTEFYDVTLPVRRELHRAYIWHGLDVLADHPNVIHTAGFQFAGPLTFQQFFLDTVADWERARGRRALIALNTSKAITDAILADSARASHVAVIDQRYWQYLADGTLFAPHTDGDKAFREDRAAAFGKDAIPAGTPELVYKQVRAYRDRFPDKPILTAHAGCGPIPILMAGGAYPLLNDFATTQPAKANRADSALFAFLREHLAGALPTLKPHDHLAENAWCLTDEARTTFLFCSLTGDTLTLEQPLPTPRTFTAFWFNPATGAMLPVEISASATHIRKPDAATWLFLLQ